MTDLIAQIKVLLDQKNLPQAEKEIWWKRVSLLDNKKVEILFHVLDAKTEEELNVLQQENLHQLEETVTYLQKLAQRGQKALYQKAEEVTRQKEQQEQEEALQQVGKIIYVK